MRPRASAAEWRKRVQRWDESGLSAEQFAAETGIGAPTLRVWRSKLRRAGEAGEKEEEAARASAAFVEVHATGTDSRFELELGNGRRLRVPEGFDSKALE